MNICKPYYLEIFSQLAHQYISWMSIESEYVWNLKYDNIASSRHLWYVLWGLWHVIRYFFSLYLLSEIKLTELFYACTWRTMTISRPNSIIFYCFSSEVQLSKVLEKLQTSSIFTSSHKLRLWSDTQIRLWFVFLCWKTKTSFTESL